MKILITGGAGFIGSNFAHYITKIHPDYEIIILDKLTYAGRKENLQDIINKITFIKGDIINKEDVEKIAKECNCIINFAAETHVDRSIVGTDSFILTNVFGTYILLEACRKHNIQKFLHISTDEVYGSILNGSFKENGKLSPSNPYSASKASADLLCKTYFETYGLNGMITRSTNNFGPYQHPEKFIAKIIINILNNKKIPIYGKGKNSRDWIFVEDNCEAIDLILHKGEEGEIYNIAGKHEMQNTEVVNAILKKMGKGGELIEFVKDRPGHDLRYSLDTGKINKLGWEPKTNFEDGIEKTIKWFKGNTWWWKPIVENGGIDFHKKW
jgi:dTDP-glucose 4,6-dehydratase